MPEQTLRNCRILVVEDEYMLADDLRNELDEAGAVVLGPVGTMKDAMSFIASHERIDGALLDVNLRGDMVFPAADLLAERCVPFVFTTGYDATSVPERFEHVGLHQKPLSLRKVTASLGRAMQAT